MFCFSGTNRRASWEFFPVKLTVSVLCPKEGRHSCIPAVRGDPRVRVPRHLSGIVEGPNLSGFGSSDNQSSWSSKLSIVPGERGCEFLAAFSYLPNPFGCDGFSF